MGALGPARPTLWASRASALESLGKLFVEKGRTRGILGNGKVAI